MKLLRLHSMKRWASSSHAKQVAAHAEQGLWLGVALLALGLVGCEGNGPAEVATSPVSAQTATANGTLEVMHQLHVLSAIPASEANKLKRGALLKQLHFQDKEGEAILLLSREDGVVKGEDGEDDSEQVVLRAALYRRGGEDASFEAVWQREQPTQCQDLDLDAGYFLDQVQVTDLDHDGRAEITLASHSFCGGGVDPQQLKIELLQGEQQYVIDGESLVEVDGDAPFGGERRDSDDLADAPTVFRDHLDRVWEQVRQMPKAD